MDKRDPEPKPDSTFNSPAKTADTLFHFVLALKTSRNAAKLSVWAELTTEHSCGFLFVLFFLEKKKEKN